ncbi:hypothetical protein BKA64DRAFT_656344 [Cadophora sp. MPI-SDFR-AT-0126]|nr:hypothetical protein BKA64DRAFT_656344 [Leotiomycetes sp. MPI-SDFR-AT-0126]
MASTSAAQLTCLCGNISVPGGLLEASRLPIQLKICHCNFCRHVTGSLGMAFPPLRASPAPETLAKLTAYKESEKSELYFCPKCGCYCFISTYQKNWFCTSGMIEKSPSSENETVAWSNDVVKISCHDFVLDTIDGGLTPFLLNLNGRSIPTWQAAANKSPGTKYDLTHEEILSLSSKSIKDIPPPGENDYVPAKCRCGGVSLLIKRGNYTSSSPVEFSTRSLPSDPTKYLTYLCACRSCRLSTGASLTPWALVPPSSVFNNNIPTQSDPGPNDNRKPVTFGHGTSDPISNPGLSLKHNWSSPDTCRSFCGVCGATVSYWCAKRPLELDLATGLFRAEEGSMARNWLEWDWGRCSFEEECVDREMLEAWKGCANVMGAG